MIDIHTHVLHNVDDGSDSIETSYKMLFNAKNEGIDILCLTPHFSAGIEDEFKNKFDKLNAFSKAINLGLIKGCEYHFSDLSLVENDNYITINNKGYVLIDFSSSFMPPNVMDIFFDLEVKSYKILLAHPERLFTQLNIEALHKMLENGVCFQVNAPSLLGYYGSAVRLFSHELIESGHCHVIASDSHNLRSRKFYMNKCYHYIENYYDEDLAKLLFYENPLRVINGETLIQIDDDYEITLPKKLIRKYLKIY